MSAHKDRYVFSAEWENERARLGGLAALCDPTTQRHLTALGVGPGWRCLEIGGGAGTIARWLASAIGPAGRLVVTDLDTRFLEDLRSERVEVLRHDIRTDPIEGLFDLIHARAVLEYLASRGEIVPRLVAALRPGGVLLLEDVLFGGAASQALAPAVMPPELAPLLQRLYDAASIGYQRAGADSQYGIQLPSALVAAGLEDVDAEVSSALVRGGSVRALWYGLTIQQFGPRLVDAGLLSAEEADRLDAFSRDPAARFMSVAMVSAWGRRPAR